MRLYFFFLFLFAPMLALAQSAPATLPASQPISTCGNSITESTEACDDGNTKSGDGCRNDCRKQERCGDGFLDKGESCDDGNNTGSDSCPATCQIEIDAARVCSNNFLDLGETCDDGNTADGDSCPATCFSLSLPDSRGKIPEKARQRALLATGLGAPLLGLGLIVGPSAGHFYAGEWGRGLISSTLRLVAARSLVVGLSRDSVALNVTGAAGLIGLGLYDIFDAPSSVKRTSLKKIDPTQSRLTIPLYEAGLSATAGAVLLGVLSNEALIKKNSAISAGEIFKQEQRFDLFRGLSGVAVGAAVLSGVAGYLFERRAKALAPVPASDTPAQH